MNTKTINKHYRQTIEKLEKEIVDYINNPSLTVSIEIQEIVKSIRNKFGSIICAEHLGNNYDSIGDIKIITPTKECFIEFKKIKKGKGTLANISQDALTKYNVFSSEVMSWSEYRQTNNFDLLVYKIINLYDGEFNFTTKANFYQTVRIYKDKVDFQPYKRAIETLANRDKLNYINYLSQQTLNQEALATFVTNMFNGKHSSKTYYTKEDLNYYTLLIMPHGNIWLSKNEMNINNLKIDFSENRTSIGINNGVDNLLKISFHWKNIFQGISTPCLNIFDVRSDI